MKFYACTLFSKHVRKVSFVLLITMLGELLLPLKALALTSGPSQPEFQGFTPLATTSMVDPFSGDFSYNIPLLEIDGYPLNLVYRATSNIEEEGSWVGYGWNVNVGTLNRMVRGLPDDMNGESIKSYQNMRDRWVKSKGISFEPNISFNVGVSDGLKLSAGVRSTLGFTEDDDDYTGKAVGVSIGAGVFAGVQAGPFNATANAGVTLSANTSTGGSISTYAGFNAGASVNEYVSAGFGKSVNRTFNTISGWSKPNVNGSFNISSITWQIQKNFLNSVSNDVPQVTIPYKYAGYGTAYRLDLGVEVGVIENLGIDMGLGITVTTNRAVTSYKNSNIYKGYGYMYSENAQPTDMLDFTRDNDGGINKDMPFMPPAMKTFDVFSSTAHGASSTFRADRNDFGVVRDPRVEFNNTELDNTMHQLSIKAHFALACWLGVSVKYDNTKTATDGYVSSGGSADDMVPYRTSNGKDQNLFFRASGSPVVADSSYMSQVNKYGFYRQNKAHKVRGNTDKKRPVSAEPIAVYTNGNISTYPSTVVAKKLESYRKNQFPINRDSIAEINRTGSDKIGAVTNINKSGQIYIYATPVNNNIKNDVAFRVNGFHTGSHDERKGILWGYDENYADTSNKQVRDYLFKNTLTPAYATSYLLNAVLSPDYVDVQNNGITDDDLGGFVKFNYTKTDSDYRWRIPYDSGTENVALLNKGVKLTKFDDIASYTVGSKEMWYPHSIESKNHVAEFYLSPRIDAKDSKSKVISSTHPHADAKYDDNKGSFSSMQRLDTIKYYDKHDRYFNKANAVPLKTIYFEYDYHISGSVPNSDSGKLRLKKIRVRHGNEPLQFAETYNLGYTASNPTYDIGSKDGWGNYCNNSDRPLPLCEFPYIDQNNRSNKDSDASAYHMNQIKLPSGGTINVQYEADDYSYVQNKRAMAFAQVVGVGQSSKLIPTDAFGLYDQGRKPYLYIYVEKTAAFNSTDKNFLLNGSGLMYFSFNINIAGNAFSTFDQVKGYAEVEETGTCPNNTNYLYIKVKPVNMSGTNVKPSPMVNTAINMARAYASDQLYFQEAEHADGRNRSHASRLKKAGLQVADALFGKNSIAELMKDYKAAHQFNRSKSYVKLGMSAPKIGGGSRVKRIEFSDEWDALTPESESVIGYNYLYEENGLSTGVASYEPTVGGEENPLRTGYSYALSDNGGKKYPPYDPVELLKEDPVGESFYPTGAVGYSKVIIESIHKGYARSAQSRLVHEFYTSKDFPFISKFGPKSVVEVTDEDYPNPGLRDILLSFLGVSKTISSSANSYEIKQDFIIETNDMHGKPKGTYNYRLLPRSPKDELVSSTQYYYHNNGTSLNNDISVIEYDRIGLTNITYSNCEGEVAGFPRANIVTKVRTVGVEIDVCTDSREVTTTENRKSATRGGGLKICIPPRITPKFAWEDAEHKHVDHFKSTTTTKIVNRYGILKSVRTFNEGAETVVENKYYDAITGEAVVQVVKDKYGDNIYTTNVPAYWTKTDLEPAYIAYPFFATGTQKVLPNSLPFSNTAPGFVSGNNFVQASFSTGEDVFHPGDEIFVRARSNRDTALAWHRVYVMNVLLKKTGYPEPDPLSMRYGNQQATGSSYSVYIAPYKIHNHDGTDIRHNDSLYAIESMFKYRSGRKNMLGISAGNYQTLTDPFAFYTDIQHNTGAGDCGTPNFLKPVINSTASRYGSVNSMTPYGLDSSTYNPVSMGVLNQPYLSATYGIFGDRIDKLANGSIVQQRWNGIFHNWYYWLPARYDTGAYVSLKPMLKHYDDSTFEAIAYNIGSTPRHARWLTATEVTRSIPSLGPVEEKNAVGIYNSIFPSPVTKKVIHVTANGKFGQTWVETFEDMRHVRQYNGQTDFMFSPFHKDMSKSITLSPGYKVYDRSQSITSNLFSFKGAFTIDSTQSHTGLYSIKVTSNTVIKILAENHASTSAYANVFDFNLDAASQKFTFEVWAKNFNGNSPLPAVSTGTGVQYVSLKAVSPVIDGWVLYRMDFSISDNSNVQFRLPQDYYYDDLRVYPATANVKGYVYHPFKGYLMAVLDENNYATFYEYNTRNQLVRLKKETEKGIITTTENIKNIQAK